MKAASFSYHRPERIEDALELLGSLGDAKILAGGQSLVPMLNMRFVQPEHIIDINRIAGLDAIALDGRTVRIGAMTRQAALARSDLIARELPVMVEALAHVGHFQTRNRGTIGGSLCHLDPAAELAAVAALHDAEITVRSATGERVVKFADWPLGYMTASLAPEEVATEIAFPLWDGRPGHAFVEFSRRHGDFAIVAVGCLMALDGAGKIVRSAIAVAGADQVVRRLGTVETLLAGRGADEATFADAARLAGDMDTMDDAHVSAAYRKRLVKTMTGRALALAASRAKGGGKR